jgi:peptide/nickel transport system ATP-binding protein
MESSPLRSSANPLLSIDGLTVQYRTGTRVITALNNVTLDVEPSEVVAIVGESGCGKSTLGLSIINLLQKPPAKVTSGQILLQGTDLLSLKESEMAKLRGTQISMIFQDPMSSLDPVYTVGQQLTEAIEVRERRGIRRSYGPHPRTDPSLEYGTRTGLTRLVTTQIPTSKRRGTSYSEEAVEALSRVQIPDPERVLDKYPHELSGGMAQRVMIAQALVEKPSVLIADEPTSALDVTTQAQVLTLIRQLSNEIGSSILFITHDLAVAAQIADRVAVMYAAELVEVAKVNEIFKEPLHPYAEGLILSFPHQYKNEGKLQTISGEVPDLKSPPPGCRFHPRCKYAFDRCPKEHPELIEVRPKHRAACFLRYSS